MPNWDTLISNPEIVKSTHERTHYLLQGWGETDAPRPLAPGVPGAEEQRRPDCQCRPHPPGRGGAEAAAGADELQLPAERGRLAAGFHPHEHQRGHGHRPHRAGRDAAAAPAHPGEEGRAGAADAGDECPGAGLPPGVPPQGGDESGGEPAMGERAAGSGVRQGREGHHPRVLHHDGERGRPDLPK